MKSASSQQYSFSYILAMYWIHRIIVDTEGIHCICGYSGGKKILFIRYGIKEFFGISREKEFDDGLFIANILNDRLNNKRKF